MPVRLIIYNRFWLVLDTARVYNKVRIVRQFNRLENLLSPLLFSIGVLLSEELVSIGTAGLLCLSIFPIDLFAT